MIKKIGFVSLGCAKNLTDTETMLGILTDKGYGITADVTEADIIVVNTCAFIDSAKEESISAILEMALYKEQKCELLIVCGCLAQRYREDIEVSLPEVDIILGTTDYARIAEVIDCYYTKGEKLSFVGDANSIVGYDLPRIRTTASYTAYVKIADGCDNFCTYCIIPKLRGKYKSRPMESILNEVKALAKEGVKEVILIAQDTACYGKDDEKYDLADLLEQISAIDGIEWIRLQYCYPENITKKLVDEIANNPKVVKYLDMPLQHISDSVLKRMGRRSRQKEVQELIEELRKRIPNIVIRTSLIVGFPGETDEDFETLKEFLVNYPLDRVGAFTYSCEEGTPAAEFPEQIPEQIKEQRHKAIMELLQEISYKRNQDKIGNFAEAIIEGYDEDNFCYVGRTAQDTPDVDGTAYIYSKYELNAGDIVNIRILEADEYDVTGEVENEFTK